MVEVVEQHIWNRPACIGIIGGSMHIVETSSVAIKGRVCSMLC